MRTRMDFGGCHVTVCELLNGQAHSQREIFIPKIVLKCLGPRQQSPKKGAPQAQGDKPNPSKVKAWRDGP